MPEESSPPELSCRQNVHDSWNLARAHPVLRVAPAPRDSRLYAEHCHVLTRPFPPYTVAPHLGKVCMRLGKPAILSANSTGKGNERDIPQLDCYRVKRHGRASASGQVDTCPGERTCQYHQ